MRGSGQEWEAEEKNGGVAIRADVSISDVENFNKQSDIDAKVNEIFKGKN